MARMLKNIRNLAINNSWGRCTSFHQPYESAFYNTIEADGVRQCKLHANRRMQWFDETGMTELDLHSFHRRENILLVVNISDNVIPVQQYCILMIV